MKKLGLLISIALTAACSGEAIRQPTFAERAYTGFTSGEWDTARIRTRRCPEIFPGVFEQIAPMSDMYQVAEYFTANGIPANPDAPARVGDISNDTPVNVRIVYYGLSSMFGDMDPHDMEVAACFLSAEQRASLLG